EIEALPLRGSQAELVSRARPTAADLRVDRSAIELLPLRSIAAEGLDLRVLVLGEPTAAGCPGRSRRGRPGYVVAIRVGAVDLDLLVPRVGDPAADTVPGVADPGERQEEGGERELEQIFHVRHSGSCLRV